MAPRGGVPGGLGARVAPVDFGGAQPRLAALPFVRCVDGGADRQYCHIGNQTIGCNLRLFQDAKFEGKLTDSKSTQGGALCIAALMLKFCPLMQGHAWKAL